MRLKMLRNVLFSLVANQLIIRMVTLTLCLKIRCSAGGKKQANFIILSVKLSCKKAQTRPALNLRNRNIIGTIKPTHFFMFRSTPGGKIISFFKDRETEALRLSKMIKPHI